MRTFVTVSKMTGCVIGTVLAPMPSWPQVLSPQTAHVCISVLATVCASPHATCRMRSFDSAGQKRGTVATGMPSLPVSARKPVPHA